MSRLLGGRNSHVGAFSANNQAEGFAIEVRHRGRESHGRGVCFDDVRKKRCIERIGECKLECIALAPYKLESEGQSVSSYQRAGAVHQVEPRTSPRRTTPPFHDRCANTCEQSHAPSYSASALNRIVDPNICEPHKAGLNRNAFSAEGWVSK